MESQQLSYIHVLDEIIYCLSANYIFSVHSTEMLNIV
nr:MAG TPA: hypothetical protein [Caudoviricetes sp.]